MSKREARWEVCRSDDGQFFARFRASNGQLLVTSETYKRKRTALRVCEVVNDALSPIDDHGDFVDALEVRDLT